MRHLDLSFEGKLLAEKNQLDNGKLPHGGYRGSKKHPPSHLSYDKGREFHQRLEEELSRIMEVEDMEKHGGSPSWSLLVHSSPSYTDESPLITNNLLAASKVAQINGINLSNRTSLLPKKCPRPGSIEGGAYYRPNRMHQYLSATELKNSASENANVKYGRPTRTTLLRARQRSNSAPLNQLEKKRELVQRLDEIKTAPAGAAPTTEYLQLQSVRDGESLHSYLTGARYNRAHCLDSKSVENNGVYMPRHNPALGCFFTGPKGQEYLQEFEESPRQDFPTPPAPPNAKRRPLTAPSHGRRPVHPPGPPVYKPDQQGSSKYKYLKLNIVGSRLPIVNTRDTQQPLGMRLPKLPETVTLTDRRLDEALDQTYLVNQPMPSPNVLGHGDMGHHFMKHIRSEEEAEVKVHRREEDAGSVGAIRIDGKSTWKTKPVVPSSEAEEEEEEEEVSSHLPFVVEAEKPTAEEEKKEEGEDEKVDSREEEEEIVLEKNEDEREGLEPETSIPEVREGEETREEDQRDSVEEQPEGQKETEVEEKLDNNEQTTEGDKAEEEEKEEEEEEGEEPHEEDSQEAAVNEQPGDQLETKEEVPSTSAARDDDVEKEVEVDEQEGVRFFITEDAFGNKKSAPASAVVQEDTPGDIKDGQDPLSEIFD